MGLIGALFVFLIGALVLSLFCWAGARAFEYLLGKR